MVSKHRGSHQRCSVEIGVLRNFVKFTGKHLSQRLFFNKVAGPRPLTLLKKSLWHRCFPVNFTKFLRTLFYRRPPDDCFCKQYLRHNLYESFTPTLCFVSRFSAYCLISASKNYSTIPPFYSNFYRLLLATSKDHWVPRLLFVL